MQEASPQAVVSLINGLFATDYPPDSTISFLNKEKVTAELKQIVSDMMMAIGDEVFHIEAQIDDDLNMALRMFQYGYHEAINRQKTGDDGIITIKFPQAHILYWETTYKTPDEVILHVIFPDGAQHDFKVPAFKVLEHGIAELGEKNLALLLPFYMLKFRKQVTSAKSTEERLALAPEFEKTMKSLLEAVEQIRESGILTEGDRKIILGEIRVIYSELYLPYKEFEEAKQMLEEAVLTCFDEQDQKWQTRLDREKREEKLEAAQDFLKAGVSADIVAQSLKLPLPEIEKLTRTVSSSNSGK